MADMYVAPATPPENPPEQSSERITARARYEALVTAREPYLRRAREAAALTIPSLMPPQGHTSTSDLPTPWQSVGSDGVNSLASKLLLALLPPGSSFFRLTMDDFVVAKLEAQAGGGQAGEDARGKFEAALGKIERAVINRLEQIGARIAVFESIKQLLVAGNGLLQMLDKGRVRLHYLDHYVVKRDPSGNVLDAVVWEQIAHGALTPEARALYEASDKKDEKSTTTCDLYTWIKRDTDTKMWKVHQEIGGSIIPSTQGSYPLDKSPWIPLRYTRIDGEDYGRGRVEEYLGDFRSLDSLSQSVVEGSALAAKTIFLMNPGGVTLKSELTAAPNGAVVDGDLKDIGVLKLDKQADLSVTANMAMKLEARLNKAFMVNETRDAERVTAEEIRATAAELEKTLGGVYSILSQELQLPLVSRLMFQMQRERALPVLPQKLVSPQIITGLEALGRGSDLQKLDMYIQGVAAEFGPNAVTEYVNVGAYMKRRATAMQIDLDGLIRSEEEVQASRQQQAQQDMISKLGPQAIAATAKGSGQLATPGQPAQ